jgi:hypothetical protein
MQPTGPGDLVDADQEQLAADALQRVAGPAGIEYLDVLHKCAHLQGRNCCGGEATKGDQRMVSL